jgi:hypothetical protein
VDFSISQLLVTWGHRRWLLMFVFFDLKNFIEFDLLYNFGIYLIVLTPHEFVSTHGLILFYFVHYDPRFVISIVQIIIVFRRSVFF